MQTTPTRVSVAVKPTPRRTPTLWVAGLGAVVVLCVSLSAILAWTFLSNRTDAAQFKLDAAKTYAVSDAKDTRVTDSATGVTLRFPDGGSGNLQIAKIISGPAAPYPGEGIHLEYAGATPTQLMLKDSENGTKPVVMGYGYLPGAYVENQWIEVPEAQSVDGYRVFDLTLPFTATRQTSALQLVSLAPWLVPTEKSFAAPPMGAPQVGFANYWIGKLPANPANTDVRVAIGLQHSEDMDHFMAEVPPSLRDNVAKLRERHLMNYDYAVDPNADSYYTGFWYFTPLLYRYHPKLHISERARPQELPKIIAHETGHYATHLLMGDTAYATLEAQTPMVFHTQHGVGDQWGSRTAFFMEEPAYFIEYFFTGGVNGFVPNDVRGLVAAGGLPEKVDYPTLEGFGFVMLQALQQTETAVRTPGAGPGEKQDVPVVGASFGEVFELIGKGASNINQLCANIKEFLKSQGQQDKLPALAQRAGWRYTVRGHLLNLFGDPVGGMSVEAISRVGCQDYRGGKATNETGADGKFELDQVFPDDSLLRVTGHKNADGSQAKWDIPIKIEWAQETNQVIDLDIKMGRLEMFIDGKPHFDAAEFLEVAPGKHTFKAVAKGLPSAVKSLRWQWRAIDFQTQVKDSGIQSTEVLDGEFVIPASSSSATLGIDLLDTSCGDQRVLDMGHVGMKVAAAEAPMSASPQAMPTEQEAASNVQATPTATSRPPTFTPASSPQGATITGEGTITGDGDTQIPLTMTFITTGGAATGNASAKANIGNCPLTMTITMNGAFDGGDGGAASGTLIYKLVADKSDDCGGKTTEFIGTWNGNFYANGTGKGLLHLDFPDGVKDYPWQVSYPPFSSTPTQGANPTPTHPDLNGQHGFNFRTDKGCDIQGNMFWEPQGNVFPIRVDGSQVTIDYDKTAQNSAFERHLVVKGSGTLSENDQITLNFHGVFTQKTIGGATGAEFTETSDGTFTGTLAPFDGTPTGSVTGTLAVNGNQWTRCTAKLTIGIFDPWEWVERAP